MDDLSKRRLGKGAEIFGAKLQSIVETDVAGLASVPDELARLGLPKEYQAYGALPFSMFTAAVQQLFVAHSSRQLIDECLRDAAKIPFADPYLVQLTNSDGETDHMVVQAIRVFRAAREEILNVVLTVTGYVPPKTETEEPTALEQLQAAGVVADDVCTFLIDVGCMMLGCPTQAS